MFQNIKAVSSISVDIYCEFCNFIFHILPGSIWSPSAHISSFEMHVDQMKCYIYRWREVQMKVYFSVCVEITSAASGIYMLSGYTILKQSYVSSSLYFNTCLFISTHLDAPKLIYFYIANQYAEDLNHAIWELLISCIMKTNGMLNLVIWLCKNNFLWQQWVCFAVCRKPCTMHLISHAK